MRGGSQSRHTRWCTYIRLGRMLTSHCHSLTHIVTLNGMSDSVSPHATARPRITGLSSDMDVTDHVASFAPSNRQVIAVFRRHTRCMAACVEALSLEGSRRTLELFT